MQHRVREAVDSWRRWLDELEAHPLDAFEYDAMLMVRDELMTELEVAGIPALWVEVDALDVRFRDMTVEADSPITPRTPGWWWRRVPADDDAFRYLRGE